MEILWEQVHRVCPRGTCQYHRTKEGEGPDTKGFVEDPDFLSGIETAVELYHDWAERMPIADYHCYIDPKSIWEDWYFEDLSQAWLRGDHYKWWSMRSNDVPEKFITEEWAGWEKFQKFAEVLPRAIGNPMYHWCHLELKNYLGCTGVPNGEIAQRVWDLCNEKLRSDLAMSVRGMTCGSNVAMVGIIDDPCSDLVWHGKLLANRSFASKVLPSSRPDPAVNLRKAGFVDYLRKSEGTVGREISTVEDVRQVPSMCITFFGAHGCRSADHGLDYVMFRPASGMAAIATLRKVRVGEPLVREEAEGYQIALLLHCVRGYARLGWAIQPHFSCMRSPNTKIPKTLGSGTGFDHMVVTDSCSATYRLLDTLEQEASLPRTVLYSLNPTDNVWIDTLLGAFQSPEVPGKVQHGSARRLNGHKAGMTEHLTGPANLGVLGNSIGMLTDNRSLLSYVRHEYFWRVLCDLLDHWVENGEYPRDMETLGGLV